MTTISISTGQRVKRAGLGRLRYLCLGVIAAGLTIFADQPIADAQTEDPVVAVVNGKSITQREVDQMILPQLLPLQEQMYAVRKAALENLIIRAILEDAASKRAISIDELKRQLTTGKVEIPASEVDEQYSAHVSVFGAMSPDEARERLRLDLESHARMKLYRDALVELRKSSRIEVRLEEPRLPSISDNGAPAIGSKNAAVTIIEFSDFQCPYCRGSQRTLKQILQSYGNQARLVFKHLPLDIHAAAFGAAQAAFCAGEQGLFWQYHDSLFVLEELSAAALNKIAMDVGLSMPTFKTCLNSEISRTAILKDVRQARQFGISSTPTFVINGKLVRGAIDFEEFKIIIERELRSVQSTTRAK